MFDNGALVFFAACTKIEPYLEGHKITISIGNPHAFNFSNVKGALSYGKSDRLIREEDRGLNDGVRSCWKLDRRRRNGQPFEDGRHALPWPHSERGNSGGESVTCSNSLVNSDAELAASGRSAADCSKSPVTFTLDGKVRAGVESSLLSTT